MPCLYLVKTFTYGHHKLKIIEKVILKKNEHFCTLLSDELSDGLFHKKGTMLKENVNAKIKMMNVDDVIYVILNEKECQSHSLSQVQFAAFKTACVCHTRAGPT